MNPLALDTSGRFESAFSALNGMKTTSEKDSVTLFKTVCAKDTPPSRTNRNQIFQFLSFYNVFNQKPAEVQTCFECAASSPSNKFCRSTKAEHTSKDLGYCCGAEDLSEECVGDCSKSYN